MINERKVKIHFFMCKICLLIDIILTLETLWNKQELHFTFLFYSK